MNMQFRFIIFLLISLPVLGLAQKRDTVIVLQKDSPLQPSHILELTKVDEPATYLTDKEKEIIQWMNIARMYPKWFMRYMNIKNIDPVYTKTLIETMNNMAPIKQKLIPTKKLWQMAYCHASTAGPLRIMGHDRQDSKCKMNMNGECIYYGNRTAAEIVKRLLIDKGVPSLGHRKTILEPLYKKIGVSIQPFGKDESTEIAVIDFAF